MESKLQVVIFVDARRKEESDRMEGVGWGLDLLIDILVGLLHYLTFLDIGRLKGQQIPQRVNFTITCLAVRYEY